jgi:hypothetical protein
VNATKSKALRMSSANWRASRRTSISSPRGVTCIEVGYEPIRKSDFDAAVSALDKAFCHEYATRPCEPLTAPPCVLVRDEPRPAPHVWRTNVRISEASFVVLDRRVCGGQPCVRGVSAPLRQYLCRRACLGHRAQPARTDERHHAASPLVPAPCRRTLIAASRCCG